jgi:hypothetical protein
MKSLGEELVRGIKEPRKKEPPRCTYKIGDITEDLIRNSVPPPEATVQKQLKSGHVIMTQQVINGVQKVDIDKLPIPRLSGLFDSENGLIPAEEQYEGLPSPTRMMPMM